MWKKKNTILAAIAVCMTIVAGTSLYASKKMEQKMSSAIAVMKEESNINEMNHSQKTMGEKSTRETEEEKNTQEKTVKAIIALDPGHQGPGIDMSAVEENAPGSAVMKQKNNSGTTGRYTGLPEYQLNLDIALQVKELLARQGYEIIMSREDNETAISNQERAKQANESGAVLCVRIHANGSESPASAGALCLVMSEDNPYTGNLYNKSSELALDILESYCNSTGLINRGIQKNDTMTGINWSQIPVVILEMGFMTNEQEDTLMSDTVFQEKMAEGIANGITKYIKSQF